MLYASYYLSLVVALLVLILGLFLLAGTTLAQTIPCHKIFNTFATPSGFASPFSSLSGGGLLITAACDATGANVTLGNGSTITYIYDTGYEWDGTNWNPLSWTGQASGDWIVGTAQGRITKTPAQMAEDTYFVGYTCEWNSITSQWRCGCLDTFCNLSAWQIQYFSAPGLTGGSSSSGGSASGSSSSGGSNSGTNVPGNSVGIQELPVPNLNLSSPPPRGQHPRVLISPSDLTALRNHLRNDASGKKHMAQIRSAARSDNQPSRKLMFEAFIALIDNNAGGIGSKIVSRANANKGRNGQNPDFELALAYDFAYNFMSAGERNTVRGHLANATRGKRSYGVGESIVDREAPPNWQPHGMNLVLTALAIEGESGYDQKVYDESLALMRDFIQHEIHSDGATKEGMHYFNFGMNHGSMAMIAFAKRGDNLFAEPNYRRLYNWYVHSIEPFGYDHSDHWDSFTDSRDGGLTSNYAAMKFAWPNDRVVDFIYRNRMQNDYGSRGDRYGLLMNAIFGRDYVSNWDPASLGLDTTYYSSERGFLIARDRWDRNATVFHFENRRNHRILGHTHADRNNFTLSSHGKRWAVDWGYHVVQPYDHSVVNIDGKGQEYFTPPGEIVAFRDTNIATAIVGDAERAHDIRWTTKSRTGATQNKGYSWSPETLVPVSNNPLYKANSPNAVDRAFRTAVFVRGSNPYVLILDDIQKDSTTRTYEWMMQLDDGVSQQSKSGNDIILQNGGPRLLVRALQANGSQGFSIQTNRIERWTDKGVHANIGNHKRLNLKARTVAPDYKMLLFPHNAGEALPQTSLSGNTLTVSIGGQTDTFTFGSTGGRTTVSMNRNGQHVLSI